MAAGVPVIASDIPGNRDALSDTGILVGDEMQLLEQTLALVDDPPRRGRLGEAARARVAAEFASRRTFDVLERLYGK